MEKERFNLDDDIQQCKEEILREKEIVPPLRIESAKPAKKDTSKRYERVISSLISESESPAAKPADSKIPSLDLNTEIMAQQRKMVSYARKAPGQTRQPVKPIYQEPKKSPPAQPIREIRPAAGIIRDIVARDIARLHRN